MISLLKIQFFTLHNISGVSDTQLRSQNLRHRIPLGRACCGFDTQLGTGCSPSSRRPTYGATGGCVRQAEQSAGASASTVT